MKKFILLLLIASVGAAACKKEKKSNSRVDKPIAEAILGTWFTTSESREYFDVNNQKVFSQSVEPGWKYTIDENLRIWNPQGVRQLLTEYTISSANGKNYINYTEKGVDKTAEIVSLEQETMVLRQEGTNIQYEDNGIKTAAKMVTVMNFHCPCK
jgi:hypothetical protein